LILLITSIALPDLAYGQAENVPVTHPVYTFLKRMEVKGMIQCYHDAILPISRRQVAEFLSHVNERPAELTAAERGYLEDFLSEFQFDISHSIDGFQSLIDPGQPSVESSLGGIFSNREKYLYAYSDSVTSFFVNGLLTFEGRGITGDALGKQNAKYVQVGGRIRGTMLGHLGFYIQGTNAQFWGSRELLERDPVIGQSHALSVTNVNNFDFVEGYARYDVGIASVQIGRERVLWGNGFDMQMVLSDNTRVPDFVRVDAQYKSLKYTFMHAWLLGTRSNLTFALPSDTSRVFDEPVFADKYFAAHRLELSFPSLFDIGFQEMVIYSNRAPDLAYLNPITLIESAQRSRGERDNVMWAFDIQTHFLKNLELSGTMLYDDIHIPYLFTDKWFDRYAWQSEMFYADAFGIPDLTLILEYTRVEPFVFAHNRSRDDSYTSLGAILGPRIGSNSDSWLIRTDYLPARNLSFSLRVLLERHGANILDSNGTLIKNVGGDILQPHRGSDGETKKFLDGILFKTNKLQFVGTYQFINQMWLDALYEFDAIENITLGGREENHTFVLRMRLEF